MSEIVYTQALSVGEYNALRTAVGWEPVAERLAAIGLQNTSHLVAARLDGEAVGMARVVGDGGCVAYIADVVVLPRCQGMGVGKEMVRRLTKALEDGLQPGEFVWMVLFATKDKEPFYRSLAFDTVPNEEYGAGMIRKLKK